MKASIQQDVSAVLSAMEQDGVRAISPDVVTQEVIDGYGVHDSQDPRYQTAMYDYVRRMVSSMFNRYKASAQTDDEVDGQLVLPGYKRLQRRYLVHEGTESLAVRVEEMTDEQLLEKAVELRQMGAGCFQHAREIDRYMSERAEQIA
ncbi:MAG: hypothetical protein LAT68_14310 [Cyclobacteriaceae bacterium]|nr:hypothetical protein [Cyclobacteriaceae bacterium]